MKQTQIDEIKLGLYVFLNSFDDPCLLCKYDPLKENNPFYLLHTFVVYGCHFYITFYLLK